MVQCNLTSEYVIRSTWYVRNVQVRQTVPAAALTALEAFSSVKQAVVPGVAVVYVAVCVRRRMNSPRTSSVRQVRQESVSDVIRCSISVYTIC